MAAIITLSDLEAWIPEGISSEDEPFALVNINAASLVVQTIAKHPEWTVTGATAAPARAKLIAVQVAKRAYRNPDAVVRSNVGPLGEATVEDYARTLEPTPLEVADLEAMRPGGALPDNVGSMFVVNFAGPAVDVEETIYVPDMAGQLFPMYSVGEIGSP